MNRAIVAGRAAGTAPVGLYAIAALSSVGQFFLMTCIFFFTSHRLGWDVSLNLLLATGQGVVYAAGALAAQIPSARWGRRRSQLTLHLLMTLVCAVVLSLRGSSWIAVPLLIYVFLSSMSWPIFLSMLSTGITPRILSRRLGTYNLVWACIGAISAAAEGVLIEHFLIGVFLVPIIMHLICAALMWREQEPADATPAAAHVQADPGLTHKYRLGLWLSRIAMPTTYVVQYSLMAIMPSLPVLQNLSVTTQTLVGSVWMGGRFVIFCALVATTWWHVRPLLPLAATVAMGVAFFGVTVRPSALLGITATGDLPVMLLCQILLGIAFGLIYYSSLYFGMALGRGSTRQGSYHQALSGLGTILGPGIAATAAILVPSAVNGGIMAVDAMIGLTLLATGTIAIKQAGKKNHMAVLESAAKGA